MNKWYKFILQVGSYFAYTKGKFMLSSELFPSYVDASELLSHAHPAQPIWGCGFWVQPTPPVYLVPNIIDPTASTIGWRFSTGDFWVVFCIVRNPH